MQSQILPPLYNQEGRKWVYISLLFSLFYFLPVLFSNPLTVSQWLLIILPYLVFVGLFLVAVKQPSNRALLPTFGMLLVCFTATSITPGTNALFSFCAFIVAFHFALKRALILLAIIMLVESLAFYAWQHPLPFFAIAVLLTLALFVNGSMLRKEQLHQSAQQRSQAQIEQLATIAERERISRDLHDLLGHSLSSIALKAELADKLAQAGDIEKAQSEIKAVAELTRQALLEVRQSVTAIKQQGLNAEIGKLRKVLESSGFSTTLDIAPLQPGSLLPAMESAVILLCKEACTNILRHSNGDQASISFKPIEDAWQLDVVDNGKVTSIHEGNGISGMRQRCAQLGGQVQLDYGTSGTRLTFTLPE